MSIKFRIWVVSIVLLEMINRNRYMIPYIWTVSTDHMHF